MTIKRKHVWLDKLWSGETPSPPAQAMGCYLGFCKRSGVTGLVKEDPARMALDLCWPVEVVNAALIVLTTIEFIVRSEGYALVIDKFSEARDTDSLRTAKTVAKELEHAPVSIQKAFAARYESSHKNLIGNTYKILGALHLAPGVSRKAERPPVDLPEELEYFKGYDEADKIRELIEVPGSADPYKNKCTNVCNEDAWRTERAHLVAALYDHSLAYKAGPEATALDLFVSWRKERKLKHKTKVKIGSNDYISEVQSLRVLLNSGWNQSWLEKAMERGWMAVKKEYFVKSKWRQDEGARQGSLFSRIH